MGRYEIEPPILALIKTPKLVDESRKEFDVPAPGGKLLVRLQAPDMRGAAFLLNVNEGRRSSRVAVELYAEERKTTMQTRLQSVPLLRIDLDAHAAHTNPDGTVIHGPHLHVATAEYGDRLAFPLASQDIIPGIAKQPSVGDTFEAFREFCAIEDALRIRWSLGV